METNFNFRFVLTDDSLIIFKKGDCGDCQYNTDIFPECKICKEKGRTDEAIHKCYKLIDLL